VNPSGNGSGRLWSTWAVFVCQHPWVVLLFSGVLPLGSATGVAAGGRLAGQFQPQGQALHASQVLQHELPQPGRSSFQLVFSSGTMRARDPLFRTSLLSAVEPLKHDRRVTLVETPYNAGVASRNAMVSKDQHAALAVVYLGDEFKTASAYYPQIRAEVRSGSLQVRAAGDLAVSRDLDLALDQDLGRAELTSFPIALVLLVIVFGSLVASLLPLGVGGMTILGGTAGALLLARRTDVSDTTTDLVILLGLGLAIDYSLFVVSRFREELAAGRSTEGALVATMATAGKAITFSALTVGISLSGLLFFQGTFLPALGAAAALTVAMAIVYGMTFLPATLALLGPNVNRLRVRRLRPKPDRRFWSAMARRVMERPVVWLLPSLALLLLVGSPFLSLRLESNDLNFLQASSEARRAHAELVSQFPGQDQARIPLVVSYASGNPLSRSRVGNLYDLSRAIGARSDVSAVQGVVSLAPGMTKEDYQALYSSATLPGPAAEAKRQTVGRHIVTLEVIARDPEGSERAQQLVRALRTMSVPGGLVLVTGQTAFNVDTIDLIRSQTPLAIGFVIVITGIVLFLLLRSVVLPIKAVLLSLLSITASFGALVWIFQQGHLSSFLGFTPSPLDPVLPVLLFCIVFGISMDYEVLLLTRIREAYLREHDNRTAVAIGLQRSGPVITAAAAIAVAVFGAFTVGQVVLVKAIGLGLALAVAMDATIVRIVVVPSLMRLLGDLNWWAPPRLRSSAVHHRETSGARR
jgi:RND superfamily putative drug exporter